MISHLNGGNTMQPPEPVLSRAEWERRQPVPIDRTRLLLGAPPRAICPVCLGPMREVPGFDDYCPPCRLREELATEREVVAAQSSRIFVWFGEWSDGHVV